MTQMLSCIPLAWFSEPLTLEIRLQILYCRIPHRRAPLPSESAGPPLIFCVSPRLRRYGDGLPCSWPFVAPGCAAIFDSDQ